MSTPAELDREEYDEEDTQDDCGEASGDLFAVFVLDPTVPSEVSYSFSSADGDRGGSHADGVYR